MSFHLRFVAISAAAAIAAVAAHQYLPVTVKAIITDAIDAIPGDGPIEIEAAGHLAVKSEGLSDLHRYSQGSSISSLRVTPLQLVEAPAPEPTPKTEDAPEALPVGEGAQGTAAAEGSESETGATA